MRNELSAFLEDIQAEFLAGRLDELTKKLAVPFVLYSVAGVAVLRTREDVLDQVTTLHSALMDLAVVSSKVTVVSHEPVKNNRLRATVRSTHYGVDGAVITGSLIRYFLRVRDKGFTIEMVEYLEAPFPTEDIERLVH